MTGSRVADRLGADATVDDVVAAMDEHGYAVVERLLPPEQVASVRADLALVLDAIPYGRNDFEGHHTKRIYNLFAKTRVMDEIALHPMLVGVLDQMLGHYQFSAPVGIEIGPGEAAQVIHQDDIVYPLPWPHPTVLVNTMWAFDDFTEANGATRIIPGSHRREDFDPAPVVERAHPVSVEMPAGSAIFYPGTVLHGGGANRTDRPRLGVILEFIAAWLRPQENHLIGVPRSIVRDLPPRLQELLGWNVYPAFVGNVDGRHPRKYLDETRPDGLPW
jgi:ectoine hydroxylase-related dioxygenase (phytanoyl-CoA dioxygenase family)